MIRERAASLSELGQPLLQKAPLRFLLSQGEGLILIDAILDRGDLSNYHLAHAARADLLRRLGRTDEARSAYRQALALARQEPERRFLAERLSRL